MAKAATSRDRTAPKASHGSEWISLSDALDAVAETLRRVGLAASPENELLDQLRFGKIGARAERREFGYFNRTHKHDAGDVPTLFWQVYWGCPDEHKTWGPGGIVWFSCKNHRVFEGIGGITLDKRGLDKFRNGIPGRGAGGRPPKYETAEALAAVTLALDALSDAELESRNGYVVGTDLSEWYKSRGFTPPGESTLDKQGSDILGVVKARRSGNR